MRIAIKTVLITVAIIAVLILIPPRLWVKNKNAWLTVNGRKSEKLKLFHASHERVLIFVDEPGETQSAYVYVPGAPPSPGPPQGSNTGPNAGPNRGMFRCSRSEFTYLKLITISRHAASGCADSKEAIPVPFEAKNDLSIQWNAPDGKLLYASWQTGPR